MTAPVLEVTGVTKNYGALRPLRLLELVVAPGEQVALLGLDQPAAEVLINLVTGATLPDAGEVKIFGRATSEITDSAEWLTMLDRFGIVSDRAALLDAMSVIQNMALPFSLEIEPLPPELAKQASALAREVGVAEQFWERRVGDLDATTRMRIRLGRALAFNPGLLLLEHPSATLPREDVIRFGVDVHLLAERRGLGALTITADAEFAGAVSSSAVVLEPATGRLQRL
jgi:ABC-type transporter Mla maintaining outer membrane lipid asymmetry ATPase subunit MlaF